MSEEVVNPIEKPEMTLEEKVEKDKIERRTKCQQELQSIFVKYRCELEVEAILSVSKPVQFMIKIVAK